ncbi:hypothetical protein [Mycetocola saprophilus]|uniref:hypothetical protein n=1 Tax=Mycetocola saprophilus TaxID=76636 RepID=UPI0004C07333|nr:hypothetical protein [Mycetocola saprophilus]
MTVTIKLPGDHPGEELHAGIIFTDGKVRVDEVSPNAERYLVWNGAKVSSTKPRPAPEVAPDGEA